MSKIVLTNVDKFYGKNHVLKNLNLTIEDGDFMTLLGPSGCGKTTTLRVVSGLEKPQNGFIHMDDKEIVNAAEAYFAPPRKRNLNLVFQSYALWPHMTVFDNVAFGLKIRKEPSDVIAKKVASALERMQIGEYAKRYPTELSGGQQQRVAIARALVTGPAIICMDEPLSNLDAKLRVQLRNELKKMQKDFGITTIYVTHDQEEALTMSDTIVVMNQGYIQQIGTPEMIYNEPENAFVADFIGESNIIDGVMIRDRLVRILGAEFVCVDEGFGENMPVDVVIRPEDVVLTPPSQGELKGVVTDIIFKGVHYEMHVMANGYEWLVHSTVSTPIGAEVGLSVEPSNIQIMNKPESEDEEVFNADA